MTKVDALDKVFEMDNHLYDCIGSLRDYAKLSDKETYNELRKKYQETARLIRRLQNSLTTSELQESVGFGYARNFL